MTPRSAARLIRLRRGPVDTPGERFAGYGVHDLHFEHGDVLAFRHVTMSSIGPPFISVWHRDPGGRWTIHTSVDRSRSCPRYLDPASITVRYDAIEMRWIGDAELAVTVRDARLSLGFRLAATPRTVAAGTLARLLPRALWERSAAVRILRRTAAAVLQAAPPLAGTTWTRHCFVLRPAGVWRVEAAAAVLGGRDLGALIGAGRGAAPAGSAVFAVGDALLRCAG